MLNYIPEDLSNYGIIDQTFFKKILSVGNEAWSMNDMMIRQRRLTNSTAPLTLDEIYYRTWKGMICEENGIPVLIDDDTANVIQGCEKYGIKLFHPDEIHV